MDEFPGEEAQPRRKLRDSWAGSILVIVIATAVVLAGVWVVNSLTRSDAASPSATETAAGGVTQVQVTASAGPAPKVGEAAPDFTTFTTDGKDIELSELKGKPVWLVFGASWCQNCRAETPDVESLHKKYGEKVAIVGIYVGETISTVADYATRLNLTYPQVADAPGLIQGQYRVMALPTHYFIDPSGKVSSIAFGGLSEAQATERLDALLAAR